MRDLILQLSKSSIYSTKPRKESGRQLMDALVTFLSRNHHNVIIEGVESEAHKEWLQGMEWFAIQGYYWREVSIEQLVADDIAM
ncbi:C'-terminal of MrkJ (plasmid) [Escherichia coli PCN061]|nr:EAL domain-containing protein [Escherichia coli]AKM38308.1 C'-terminal of MrkJ [Escherichia coli PCN061]ECI4400093.1 EAL domain-containing protein [Salmonella enterica subsp. enterica]MBB7543441.1 EAL domain-containing protein [Escherichia coli]MDI4261250.1 EAL domain-containing protein [Escherichia coli]